MSAILSSRKRDGLAGIATSLQVKAAARLIGCRWQAAIRPLNRQLHLSRAHHARVDGGRVGPDLVLHRQLVLGLVGRQDAVDLASREGGQGRVGRGPVGTAGKVLLCLLRTSQPVQLHSSAPCSASRAWLPSAAHKASRPARTSPPISPGSTVMEEPSPCTV